MEAVESAWYVRVVVAYRIQSRHRSQKVVCQQEGVFDKRCCVLEPFVLIEKFVPVCKKSGLKKSE